ncbi:hypothetical protein SBADM41S_04916 [Streptomyces badius]
MSAFSEREMRHVSGAPSVTSAATGSTVALGIGSSFWAVTPPASAPITVPGPP